MPSGFFILQRFFMRVDGVLLRMNETRIYHSFEDTVVLREYTVREDRYATVATASDASQLCVYARTYTLNGHTN